MIGLQKASAWKRISAFLTDFILLCILVVGFAFLINWISAYDSHNAKLQEHYSQYEKQYNITFAVTPSQFEAMSLADRALYVNGYKDMTDQERVQFDAAYADSYDTAYKALLENKEAMGAYNLVVSITILTISLSIFFGIFILEFLIPLFIKDGQTLGKKIFSLCVVRSDGVRITTFMLFVRTILGKYTLEAMIPVILIIMIFFGSLGLSGVIVIGLIIVLQLILLGATKTSSALHDLIAHTVVVDKSSQMIFDSSESKMEYIKQQSAEQARLDNR